MVGDLFLLDKQNNRSLLISMVLANFQFIENETKVLIPVFVNNQKNGVNNYCMQIAIANLNTQSITFYEKYFDNNGESISYDTDQITVWNETNEFAKTESIDLTLTPIQKTETFEIYGNDFLYFKRHWPEHRGDEYSFWGKSWWYFEADFEGNVKRQIEEYDNGVVKCYGLVDQEDEFGGLSEKVLPLGEFGEYAISKDDFDQVWIAHCNGTKNDLYELFRRMKLRPGMYLGEKTITALWHFVNGYISACFFKGIEEDLNPRWPIFNEFVKRKTGFAESTSGWKHMILTHCNDNEERAVDVFFEFLDQFKKGEEFSQFIQTLVPKNKHDMELDKTMDLYWYNYTELQPIIPALLTWLQDLNWPVARPISTHLRKMLPEILPDLVPILESEDPVWKYNILQVFFIDNQSNHYLEILELIKKLAYRPSPIEHKEEVDLLAKQILQGYED
jgi:hypothetical protein